MPAIMLGFRELQQSQQVGYTHMSMYRDALTQTLITLSTYTTLSTFIQQLSYININHLKIFDLLVCATILVCFLNIAAAVSERVTITSRASWRCILLRLVSPHNYKEDIFAYI